MAKKQLKTRRVLQNRIKELIARKERIERRKLTYKVLEQETGISSQSIENWLMDKGVYIGRPQIEIFCEYFDCDISDLFILVEGAEEDEPASYSFRLKKMLA